MTASVGVVGTRAKGDSNADLTVAVPAGQDGELLLMFASVGTPFDVLGGAPDIAIPSGWTLEDTEGVARTGTASGLRASFFSRVAESEPASYALTASGPNSNSAGFIACIIRIKDHDGTNVTNGFSSGAPGTSISTPSVNTTVNDCLLIQACASAATTGVVTHTVSAGTEILDDGTDPGGVTGVATSFSAATEVLAVAGSTPSRTFTFSSSSVPRASFVVAIAPSLFVGKRRLLLGVG